MASRCMGCQGKAGVGGVGDLSSQQGLQRPACVGEEAAEEEKEGPRLGCKQAENFQRRKCLMLCCNWHYFHGHKQSSKPAAYLQTTYFIKVPMGRLQKSFRCTSTLQEAGGLLFKWILGKHLGHLSRNWIGTQTLEACQIPCSMAWQKLFAAKAVPSCNRYIWRREKLFEEDWARKFPLPGAARA